MKKMSFVLCIAAALFLIRPAYAVTLDFEGVPLTYYYLGGNLNLGNFYPGVNFGPDATILDYVIYGYDCGGYPPHSGNAVLFSGTLPYIDVIFDAPVSNVSVWYTSPYTLYLEAYADVSMSIPLGTTPGPSNSGTNSQLTLNLSGIRAIRIHNGGNNFTIDDLTYDVCQCPDGLKGCISGTVTETGTGTPIAGMLVLLREVYPNHPSWKRGKVRKATTDSNGCYIFDNLQYGRYNVFMVGQCMAIGGFSHQFVEIRRGGKVNDVNFECK